MKGRNQSNPMKRTLLSLFAIATPLLVPLAARAALNPAIVSAEARWIVHVDLINLRDSHLGQVLLGDLQKMAPETEQGGLRPDFAKILQTAGTLTAYGTSFSKDPNQIDGALLLQGTPDLRKIAEGLVAQQLVTNPEKIKEIEGLPFEAYAIEGGITVAFPKEPVILLSKSQAQLVKAYDVFRGAAPSFAKNKKSALNDLLPKDGGYFLVAASVVPSTEGLLSDDSSHSRILKMATAGALAVGEQNNMTEARLQLVASSDDMAERLSRILQGMAALVSLTQTNDKDLNAFLQSITTERKDNKVSLSLSYPSDRLIEMAREIQKHGHEGMAMHGMGNNGGDQPAAPAPTEDIGKVVGTWMADADLPGDAPTRENLTSRTFENVALTHGATVAISGRRGGGEHARIDYVEVAPVSAGNPAMRYEAEYMRLENYQIEKLDGASEGEVIRLRDGPDHGTARFHFQGQDGTYRVIVGYVDEADGQSSFALGVQAENADVEAPAQP